MGWIDDVGEWWDDTWPPWEWDPAWDHTWLDDLGDGASHVYDAVQAFFVDAVTTLVETITSVVSGISNHIAGMIDFVVGQWWSPIVGAVLSVAALVMIFVWYRLYKAVPIIG